MRMDEFAEWLRTTYRTKQGTLLHPEPQSDAKSRCKRVEKVEGDLDAHFTRDRLSGLLRRLTYSADDAARGEAPAHQIQIDGNLITGTASLRRAIRLYAEFCQHTLPKAP